MALRILVADDHAVVRQGICSLLKPHPGWEVCGEATDGRQAVEMSKTLKPDLVILDIGMPALNGLDATRQILRDNPDQRVLVLTVSDSEQLIREVLGAGARGFVLKSDAVKDLVAAVQALEHHRTYFATRVQNILDNYFAPSSFASLPTLTNREREVLQLIAEGKTTKEVAVALGCSVKTAETHRTNFMHKLQLHSVSEVVMYAIRNHIIRVDQLPASASSRSN
jgi:DNA-binding NarL/FixJ family response regulator